MTRYRASLCNVRAFVVLIVGLALLPALVRAQEYEQRNVAGLTHIFITYKAEPGSHDQFLAALHRTLRSDLDGWKRNGTLKDYLLLEESQNDTAGWTAMLILRFERYTQTEKWIAIERKQPGGLRQEALKLGVPVTTYLADRTIAGLDIDAITRDRSKSIFVFKQYTPLSTSAYKTFLTAYVKPELDLWGKEGMIKGYVGFANHHATGAPWDVMLMEEYTSQQALASYKTTREKTDAELSKNPGWRFLHSFKGNIRTSGFPTYVGRLLQAR